MFCYGLGVYKLPWEREKIGVVFFFLLMDAYKNNILIDDGVICDVRIEKQR